MGSYLSKPITDVHGEAGKNDVICYAASSMQGWRQSQEDAHNCVVNFDENTSLFAIYDGHGGFEVAEYCSRKLPETIKNMEHYRKENFPDALIDAFLALDDSIIKAEVLKTLRAIKAEMENPKGPQEQVETEMAPVEPQPGTSGGSDGGEERLDELLKEACMPLENVIRNYPNTALQDIAGSSSSILPSPFLTGRRSRRANANGEGCSGEASGGDGSNSCIKAAPKKLVEEVENTTENGSVVEKEGQAVEKADGKDKSEENVTDKNGDKADKNESGEKVNGDMEAAKKEKRKYEEGVSALEFMTQADIVDDDDSEDEEFEPTGEVSLEAAGGIRNLVHRVMTRAIEEGTGVGDDDESDDESIDGEELDGEESDDEESEEEEEEDEESNESSEGDSDVYEKQAVILGKDLFQKIAMDENPGFDSGCTAVVALIKGDTLYVANAGDSRCILSDKGVAVDMSLDHKPEDSSESDRITKAGGTVTADGRVNGGLNLSRAIGDHMYKQSSDLSNKEQMITALPDIKTYHLTRDVDFIILACDGIWNSFSSQEVVDFVKERLDKLPLQDICNELFNVILAPDTKGDGTGCDNMTCIIVKPVGDGWVAGKGEIPAVENEAKEPLVSSNIPKEGGEGGDKKRSAPSDEEEIQDADSPVTKRQKTEAEAN